MIPHFTTLRVNCNNSTYSVPMIGSGLLELKPGCKARTTEVTLESHSTISQNKLVFYTLDNTQLSELNLNFSAIPSKDRLSRVILDNRDLDDLSVKLKSILTDQETYEGYSVPGHYKNTTISLAIVTPILIVVVLYLIGKKYLKCRITTCPDRQVDIAQPSG